jgi:calcium-dependent protein kinase
MEVEHLDEVHVTKHEKSKHKDKATEKKLKTHNTGILIRKSTMIIQNMHDLEDEYEIGYQLGSGSYGIVKTCLHKTTGQERAVKIIEKSKVKNMAQFRTEVKILQTLDHPNVVKMFEFFEDDINIYLILEKLDGGELFDRVIEKEFFSEKEAAVLIKQILQAINYCHNNGVCHRDLKPENFIFATKNDDADVKIIDFGLSKIFDPTTQGYALMKTGCGTPYYISPEVLTHNYNHMCDMWSAGCILYVLLCGYPPFFGEDDREIIEAVRVGEFDYDGEEWEDVSIEAKDLISRLICKPEIRLTAAESLKHPWVKTLAKNSKKEKLNKMDMVHLKKFQHHQKMKQAAITFIATQVSSKDIAHLKRVFEALDKNGDGNITMKELKDGLKDVKNRDELLAIIEAVDTDSSGAINYTEFIAATMEQNMYLKEENLRNAFKMFDKDGSGKISIEEMKQALGAGVDDQTENEEDWHNMIEEVDIDGDGEIDFEEFISMMRKHMQSE